jgi:hypothetical protein
MVALAGCATAPGDTSVQTAYGARCSSIAGQGTDSVDQTSRADNWMQSIDPQVALSAYQLYCMKDTPLGL